MDRPTTPLNTKPAPRKRCPDWTHVPIALAVAMLVVISVAIAVTLGGGALHQFVSASSTMWGRS
jgi:hypothetical protein